VDKAREICGWGVLGCRGRWGGRMMAGWLAGLVSCVRLWMRGRARMGWNGLGRRVVVGQRWWILSSG
jgi:hypothetical protein